MQVPYPRPTWVRHMVTVDAAHLLLQKPCSKALCTDVLLETETQPKRITLSHCPQLCPMISTHVMHALMTAYVRPMCGTPVDHVLSMCPDMASKWGHGLPICGLCIFHLEPKSSLYGAQVEVMWSPCGAQVEPRWGPGGAQVGQR